MKSNDEIISDLKSLITTLNDGKKGYESAAETTDSSELKSLFNKFASERATYAAELKDHIKVHGGNEDDETSSSILGSAHRAWIDIKQAFTGNDNKSILEAIETGEKAAIEKYDALIADYQDHADHLNLLKKQREGIQSNMQQIKSLQVQYA